MRFSSIQFHPACLSLHIEGSDLLTTIHTSSESRSKVDGVMRSITPYLLDLV